MTTYLVLGAKWRDNVNGNTYCNARIINGSTGETEFYIGYQYGYGNQYMYEARQAIRERYGSDAKVVDIGCIKLTHSKIKNNDF